MASNHQTAEQFVHRLWIRIVQQPLVLFITDQAVQRAIIVPYHIGIVTHIDNTHEQSQLGLVCTEPSYYSPLIVSRFDRQPAIVMKYPSTCVFPIESEEDPVSSSVHKVRTVHLKG